MSKLSPKAMAILAAATAAGFTGVTIAGAADSSTTGTTGTTTTPAAKQRPAGPGPGSRETPLTGTTKEQVEAAALAKVPGTVVRTETDDGGVYESHIRKSDGTEVEVKVDKDFKVTSVQTRPAGGPGGHGGHGGPGGPGGRHRDLTAVAKALGVTEAKLQSALEAARPANGTRPDPRADDAAAIAKALGESTADVQKVLQSVGPAGGHRGGPGGPGGPGGDDTALVAALVKQFSVSEVKAQAAVDAARKAHEAEHAAREKTLYAAVAKALGKDAADVRKAFEAARPAKPATP